MNKKALKVLEYNKIIEFLKAEAGSEMAKNEISELMPYVDVRKIRDELSSTTEAVSLIVHKGALPIGGLYNIEGSLHLAQKGGTLNMKQLLQVHYNLNIANRVVTFLKNDVPVMPAIMSISEVISLQPRLEENIDRCILSEDEMSDNASSELRNIRRGIIRQNESIKNRMNQILNSSDNKTYLQDAIITMRDGRYVIPVKSEHKGRFPGIVHDQSATGSTLFIEPQIIVNLNNELRELEIAEQVEIARILAELSGNVSEHFQELMNNQKLLVKLDFIMAKGKLSCKMAGEAPNINEDGYLEIREARHPLIDSKKVVPISLSIGKDYNTLVVTGPNTGGKTVTLKTVGLLAMMTQTGLHIPASSMSQMPIYTNIFADIGDEQSIEQSLSTFSSHMNNIVNIIEETNNHALVLLDELGAGTDPTEGAALAIAILENLYNNGATTIATTHYNEIKKYALSTKGVENASMEFNIETLSPTYKLSIGIPGKSNAFEISRKLGLSNEIISRANMLIERGDIKFEDVLGVIEGDKKKAEAERDEAIVINLAMKKKKEEADKKIESFEKEQQRIIREAKEEAREILKNARETATEVQKELKELNKLESLGERNKKFDSSRKQLKDAESMYSERIIKKVNSNPVNIDKLNIGDRVKILSLDQSGEILTLPDEKDDLFIKIGMMKAKVNVDDLMLASNEKKKSQTKKGSAYGEMYRRKAQNISISINVQGENLDDAILDVDKYLDDAFISGLNEVTIIHGRGEGILKAGIREVLQKHKHVDSFRRGNYNEGGEGVTLVKLKLE